MSQLKSAEEILLKHPEGYDGIIAAMEAYADQFRLSPVSTDWGKLEKDLEEEAGTILHEIDGFKVFFWIKQRIELLSQQHSPDGASVVSLSCTSGDSIRPFINKVIELATQNRRYESGTDKIGYIYITQIEEILIDAYKALLTSPASKKDIEVEPESELSDLIRLRNYFGENDKTEFEHWAYNFLSGIISRAKLFQAVRDKTKK